MKVFLFFELCIQLFDGTAPHYLFNGTRPVLFVSPKFIYFFYNLTLLLTQFIVRQFFLPNTIQPCRR